MEDKRTIPKSEEEWKRILDPGQYEVLRLKATEAAFSGELLYNRKKGTYACAGCGSELFSSDTKFESGTGWPSFSTPISRNRIIQKDDRSHMMKRTEVVCRKCNGHLGHVFGDGPAPSRLRYCINSCSLVFKDQK